jgi:hypothetical protein
MVRLVLSLFLLLFLSFCGYNYVEKKPDSSFWSNRDSILLVHVVSRDDYGKYYHIGNQGLLDYAINASLSASMRQKIESIHSLPIVEKNHFTPHEKYLKNKSFQVQVVKKPFLWSDLKRFPMPEGKEKTDYAPLDYRFLTKEYKARYALVLIQQAFGIGREYYGFIPQGAPYGLANASLWLVDLKDNRLLAYQVWGVRRPAQEKWDNPPEYTSLIDASQHALEDLLNVLYGKFTN